MRRLIDHRFLLGLLLFGLSPLDCFGATLPRAPAAGPGIRVGTTAAAFAQLEPIGVIDSIGSDSHPPPAADSSATPRTTARVTLAEVRIEGDRIRDARRRLPTAFVSDLRAGVAGRAQETLSEILGPAAGVRILQYGGLGAFSTVSIRGAPPGQVSIYLDGVPLTSAAHGVVNLADLPLGALDRVEVYRGGAPLSFGIATPGGAINLVTLTAPGLRRATVVRGSFDDWEARATVGARRGAFSTLVHAGYDGARGDFAFFDDNGTGAETSDDAISRRVNNRFDAATALATVELAPVAGVRARLREDFFQKRQGVPGLGVAPALATRLVFERSITHLELERSGRAAWPGARVLAALQRERSRFRDATGALGGGHHDTDDRGGAEDLSLALEWPRLPLGASIEGGGSLRRERSDLADGADGYADPPESRRLGSGAYAGLQFRPLGEWLTLHAARRWDRVEDHLRSLGVAGSAQRSDPTRELNSPQLGVRVAAPLGFDLRANWSEAERVPDFLELFGNQGSVLGNPTLRPESGDNRDLGAAWTGGRGGWRGAVEVARFESHSKDLIVYVQNSASTVKATNISRARIRGEELSLRVRAPLGVSLSAAMTWTASVDQGAAPAWRGKTLPERPDRQGHVRLDFAGRRVGAMFDLAHIGENFLDRYNRKLAPSRTLAGAALSLNAMRGVLRFTVEGKNLGDRRVADVGGFPLPGRSLYVSCRAGLGSGSPSSNAAENP